MKWRYCVVRADGDGKDATVRDYAEHSVGMATPVQNFEEHVARLGAQGWELVSVVRLASLHQEWYFKKPIP